MKHLLYLFAFILLVSCDVKQTKEVEHPKVDVNVNTQEGELPAYDVDWVDLDVNTTTRKIRVPTVNVGMDEKEIEVPYIDANWSNDDRAYDQNIVVEAEVDEYNHALVIKEIYAYYDQLIVISTLKETKESIGDKVIRVSDQVVIHAPDMSVKHYIMGNKPNNRAFNSNFTYITSKNDIQHKLDRARKLM